MNNIILYGGSFDPFHLGHLKFVETLLINYPDQEIWILPSHNWMKPTGIFSIEERIKMCETVLKNYPNVTVLNWSIHEDTSSTYKVVNKIKNLNYKITIALGEDNLETISKWANSDNLIKENNFILLSRPSCSFIQFPPDEHAKQLLQKSTIIDFGNYSISSSQIRNNPVKYLDFVPECIKDFCKKKLILENKIKIDF